MVGMGLPSAMTTLPDRTGVVTQRPPGCAELVAAHPWETTSLGPMAGWDPVVSATVEVVLASPVPMALAYGDDYVLIYNDAYAEVIGAKHPAAMGRPAADVFGDLWQTPGVGGVIDDVYRSGQSYLEAEAQVSVARGDLEIVDPDRPRLAKRLLHAPAIGPPRQGVQPPDANVVEKATQAGEIAPL